ncbi:MAG: pilus assembly protein [Pseudomonadota bacterium]
MYYDVIKSYICDYAEDERGTAMVETVLTLPMLFWGLTAMFEFFEIHRFQSTRDKASYTIADMISRENDVITDIYIDNAMTLFNEIADDYATNQIRISILEYDEDDDEYQVNWSEVRGTGSMAELEDIDVFDEHDTLPVMNDGEQLILVESSSNYRTVFDMGFSDTMSVTTRVFTSIRFAPQLCFDQCVNT